MTVGLADEVAEIKQCTLKRLTNIKRFNFLIGNYYDVLLTV